MKSESQYNLADIKEKWKTDDRQYFETRATNSVFACLKKYNCVSVTGPSGCGKTALVRHVALQMELGQNEGYTLIPVTEARELKETYKPGRKTLYIVDDICGKCSANQSQIEKWKQSMNEIKNILKAGNCKLILSCRLEVFQNERFKQLALFKTCECNMVSKVLSLTTNEKKEIFTKYNGQPTVFQKLAHSEYLPLFYRLYSVLKNKLSFSLESFLKDPFSVLTQLYNTYDQCALLLLVISNNKLNAAGKDDRIMRAMTDVMKYCNEKGDNTGKILVTKCQVLKEACTISTDGVFYQTLHDKVFDFLVSHFKTNDEVKTILINHASIDFVCERFVILEKDDRDTNEIANYLIPIIPTKLVEKYIKRVFDGMVSSSDVNGYIRGNRNFKTAKFQTCLHDYMKKLQNDQIKQLINTAHANFVHSIFVINEKDICSNFTHCRSPNERYGIVIPQAHLQLFIRRWITDLKQSDRTEDFTYGCRFLSNPLSNNALLHFSQSLKLHEVEDFIQNGSINFLNRTFVTTIEEMNDNDSCPFDRFGILISDEMLQIYITKWCNNLTKTKRLKELMKENRPLMNLTYRAALRKYMTELKPEEIGNFFQEGGDDFLNTMFVTNNNEIKDIAENRYDSFGVVMSNQMWKKYIEKWFRALTNTFQVRKFIDSCRPLRNKDFCNELNQFLKNQNIDELITNATTEFLNTVFVFDESDIINNRNRYECFGIVIPKKSVSVYIARWFNDLSKQSCVKQFTEHSRIFLNKEFVSALNGYMKKINSLDKQALIQTGSADFLNTMLVMDKVGSNTELTIQIDGSKYSLQEYNTRWIDDLQNADDVEDFINENISFGNVHFCRDLQTTMNELNTNTIAALIHSSGTDFFKKVFVKRKGDICTHSDDRYKRIGIIITDDVLQLYIERWFELLTKTDLEQFMEKNRPLENKDFRKDLQIYTKNMKVTDVNSLIISTKADFLNRIFVMTEDQIDDKSKNPYARIGIVIPKEMINLYIERWFDYLTKVSSVEEFIEESRSFPNPEFHTQLQTYMNTLDEKRITLIIDTVDDDFLTRLFVMTKNDINDNDSLCTSIGIVIPRPLLTQYVAKWFDEFTKAYCADLFLSENRPWRNTDFRDAMRLYMKTLTEEQISSIIEGTDLFDEILSNTEFICGIFVIAESDIDVTSDLPYKGLGIVISQKMLQIFIKRWFNGLCWATSVNEYMDATRMFDNSSFKTALRIHILQLSKEDIERRLQNCSKDFLNKMFVIEGSDPQDNPVNTYESFGIVLPKVLFKQYIVRWIDDITKTETETEEMKDNRCLKDFIFKIELRKHIKKLEFLRDRIQFLKSLSGDD